LKRDKNATRGKLGDFGVKLGKPDWLKKHCRKIILSLVEVEDLLVKKKP